MYFFAAEAGPSDSLTAEDAVITVLEEPLLEGIGTANEVSRPHSSYDNTNECYRLPYVTPKKMAAKNVEKSCELDVELLNHKINTEKMLQEKVEMEMQFMKEKHQKELICIDAQTKYWESMQTNTK